MLAVLGTPAVGKSTFVHCALDLKKTSTSLVSSKKVSLDGKISIVRLLELGVEDLEITRAGKLRWPEKLEDQMMPHVDGVLAIYDVMDQNSIAPLPQMLSESLSTSLYLTSSESLKSSDRAAHEWTREVALIPHQKGLHRMLSTEALYDQAVPTVVVSSKCDYPSKSWEVDQSVVEDFCSSLHGLEIFQTSAIKPETQKRCISVILRNIMLERRGRSLAIIPSAHLA